MSSSETWQALDNQFGNKNSNAINRYMDIVANSEIFSDRYLNVSGILDKTLVEVVVAHLLLSKENKVVNLTPEESWFPMTNLSKVSVFQRRK